MEKDYDESNMIAFHASPVEHRRSVKKAQLKDWKFACWFISAAPSRLTRLNYAIPMIENMKMSSMSRMPREIIAGAA